MPLWYDKKNCFTNSTQIYNSLVVQLQQQTQSNFLRENAFRSDKGTTTSHKFVIMPLSYMLFFTTGSTLGDRDLMKNALHLLGGALCSLLLAEPMLDLSAAAAAFASFSFFIHMI